MKPQAETATATRERVLAAAERLFVKLGYEGASLRLIAGEAEANLGSIVYHFETKEGLFRALCRERLGQVLDLQGKALRACEARQGRGEPLSLEDVLRALVEPALIGPASAGNLQDLYALVFTDPAEPVLKVGRELFGPDTDQLHRLVRGLLPALEPSEFFWRYISAVGGFVIAQAFADRMAVLMRTPRPASKPEEVVEALVAAMSRALSGP